MACASNLRADLLLKLPPFSALLFEQGVVDTILAELRTADKDSSVAFGKKSVPDKSHPGPSPSVQNHDLWSEHSSKDFHQAMLCNYRGTQVERHKDLCLPG